VPLFPTIKKRSRASIALFFALLVLFAGHARAEAVTPKPIGPWVVTEAKDSSNIGLIFYFSPDGTFGLIDPKTKIGAAGSYSMGHVGLMINVFNIGKSAEFIVGNLSIAGDNMVIDVKRSSVMDPQRVVLQSVRIIPPIPAPTVPVAK
jgi:hypothetical protein